MIKVVCEGCKKEFDCTTRKYNQNTKLNIKIYCSSECHKSTRKGKHSTLVKCATCGIEVMKPNAVIKRSITGNVYCSRSCSNTKNNTLFKTSENHPSYTNGERSYRRYKLNSVESPKCEVCGFDKIVALEVHHKDGNRKNNKLENLKILCRNCHAIEHFGDVV